MSEVRQLAGARYLEQTSPHDGVDRTAAAAIQAAMAEFVDPSAAVRRGEQIEQPR